MSLMVTPFFDFGTNSYTYVVVEPCSRTCAVIDPVLDYDPITRTTSTERADEIVSFVKANDLIVEWLLETHVHADHLSAARYLKSRFVCAQTGIGADIRTVRSLIDPDAPDPELCFDRLLHDGDRIALGHASGRVLATPGHTPACVSYRFEDLVFVGDVLFMPDFGSGRCDFPGGDPRVLYQSVQRLLNLPDQTRLFTGHDYGPGGRPVRYLSTVSEQRTSNIHFGNGADECAFAHMRTCRDKELDAPALLDVAVGFNLCGGKASAREAATVAAAECAA
jgi:glyoxylase-like metal-dependent hydrolase (beta-lactamase superfamily II)